MNTSTNRNPMVAVTGSSGHVGSALIPLLDAQGYRMRCLYRKVKPETEAQNVTWVKGELREANSIEELLRGCEVLIHCAGVVSVGEDNREEVAQVNIEGTRKLVQACENKDIRFIHISSSTATYSNNPDQALDEKAPLVDSREFYYGWTKARAEEIVAEAVLAKGLDGVILRPTALVGPPDRQPSRFGRVIFDLHEGRLPMISNGGYDLLDIRDFCQTVINSIALGEAGEVYLTGGSFHSIREVAKLARPERIPPVISVDLLMALLPLIRLYSRYFRLPWPINRESLLTLKRAPRRVDSSKAIKKLNHKVRPLNESVSDLIKWKKKQLEND